MAPSRTGTESSSSLLVDGLVSRSRKQLDEASLRDGLESPHNLFTDKNH